MTINDESFMKLHRINCHFSLAITNSKKIEYFKYILFLRKRTSNIIYILLRHESIFVKNLFHFY